MTGMQSNPSPHEGGASLERMLRVYPLTIAAVFNEGERVGHAYILNLSLTGVFMATEEVFEDGERFRLRFYLPLQVGSVDADVIVRWRTVDANTNATTNRPGYGLEFTKLEEPSRTRISRFIDRFVQLASDLDC